MMFRASLLAAVFAVAPVWANSFTFSDFSNPGGLTLVQDTSVTANRLRLTAALENQVGAAWYSNLVDVQAGFTTTFQFQITDRGGHSPDWEPGVSNNGADGFTFMVQNASPTALGLYASGIGYYNIPNSLAVEFDTWHNKPSYCEPNGNHIAINSLGTLNNRPEHCAGTEFDGTFTNPTLGITPVAQDMSNGTIYTERIVYSPGTMNVFFNDLSTPILSVAVDLSTLLNLDGGRRAYIGFTSSTGGAWENHDILSWQYEQVPEPATWLLLGAGLSVLGALKRRC